AHHLLAYVEMLEEDKERILDVRKRIDVLPLGSAALGGSSLPLDQKFLAQKLKFSKISTNSMAAVSDRAVLTEFLCHLAVLWMHLSRLSEDFILWNSEAFHYIELDDAFSTGSSLMPQKKNPDVFELIRARSAVVFGAVQTLLSVQKGLPLAYNRDLQEDKPCLFDAILKTERALDVLAPTLETMILHPEFMESSVQDDCLFATDILEYLVRKGIAFAEAHEVVGKIVRYASESEKPIRELSVQQWEKFHPGFDDAVYELFEPAVSVEAKKTIGSTNPTHVKSQITFWKQRLKKKAKTGKTNHSS
ncbi:argininosuccinate lyase, partial [Omnitrophica bacterium]|nr:argininosuccinate lyase [Candidatus Omnitrophota bacterium]